LEAASSGAFAGIVVSFLLRRIGCCFLVGNVLSRGRVLIAWKKTDLKRDGPADKLH